MNETELTYRIYRIHECPGCENFCWDYKKGVYIDKDVVGKCRAPAKGTKNNGDGGEGNQVSLKQAARVRIVGGYDLTRPAPECLDFIKGKKRAGPCKPTKRTKRVTRKA